MHGTFKRKSRIRRIRSRSAVAAFAAVLTLALGGCAAPFGAPRENPPFEVKIDEQRVTPDAALDPVPADPAVYRSLAVLDGSGHTVRLDAEKTPVLFVAYWCPHCQRTLQLLCQHRASLGRLPVVVSMGFVPGTPLSQAVSLTRQEEQALHLTGLTVYFAVDPSARQWIPRGYPTLVYASGGKLQMLYGEHTLQVWQQVLAR